jgi:hypothetical protein
MSTYANSSLTPKAQKIYFKSSLLSSFSSLISIAFMAAALTSCMPTESPLPVSSGTPSDSTSDSNSSSNFDGITKVETISANKVKISWNASVDPTVSVYNIYDSTLFFSPKLIKTVSAPATSTTIINLLPQNLYAFRVRAATSTGQEDTNVIDKNGIPYAGVTSSTVLSSSSARLDYPDASNTDAVRVYCKTSSGGSYEEKRSTTQVHLTSLTLTGLISGTTYICQVRVVVGSTEDNNLTTTEFTPIGQATQLVISNQPGNAMAGVALAAQPVIQIKDANGNVVTAGPDSNQPITLTIAGSSPSLGTIRGTATVNAVNGVATFSGINFQESGVKIITASKGDTSSQLNGSLAMAVDSQSFTISPAAVSSTTSTITLDPAGPVVANGSASYSVKIKLADSYGNLISGVRPQFVSTNTNDTLTQPTVNTNALGETLGSITSTVAGTRTLSINSPAGLTAVTTSAVFIAGTASKLGFTQQPTNSPSGVGGISTIKIAVQDAQGNTVTTGAAATASVTVSIFSNPGGGVLNGTATVSAVDGIATFSGLGIDRTGVGYKLVANSAPLAVAYSNNFNMTAGVPSKLAFTGPTSVISNACSTAITLQLQDFGSNPANATANTNITLSGLGGGSFYTSSACAGAALGSTITFTSGSNLKTLYFKSQVAGPITLQASDPANVLTAGTRALHVTPSKLALTGPTSVASGKCSSAFTLTTQGENGSPGVVGVNTTVGINGIAGSNAVLYSDSLCTTTVSPSSIVIPSGSSSVMVYLKDPVAEVLTLSGADLATPPMSIATTAITLTVGASTIGFTTVSNTVVAGTCSAAFTITLRDASGNLYSTPTSKTLTINGLSGTQAAFYASSSCAGATVGTSFMISANSSTAILYLKDQSAESLSLFISDPASVLDPSATLSIGISPSAFRLTGPSPASAKTNVCAGPFNISLLDGLAQVTNAITTINANLTGIGTGGAFYSDSACTTTITGLQYTIGQSTKSVYFMGLAPASLTLGVSDIATILTSANMAFTITADLGFLGSSGTLSWFDTSSPVAPVAARTNGHSSAMGLRFDPTKQYLYVLDSASNRVVKYDYTNQTLVGWIGRYNATGNIRPTGSVIPTGSVNFNSQCQNLANFYVTPGWCLGGITNSDTISVVGGIHNAYDVLDDGTSIYVTNLQAATITKYDSATGAFMGWIGTTHSLGSGATTGSPAQGPGTGLTNSCGSATIGAVTPGWCIGGRNRRVESVWDTPNVVANQGTGQMFHPRWLAYAASGQGTFGGTANFIYVTTPGQIMRYNADTGAYMGWIGRVGATPPSGPASDQTNTCSTTTNATTPGWCLGGVSATVNPSSVVGNYGGVSTPSGILADTENNRLYVAHTDSGSSVTTYNLTTGAWISTKPLLNWNGIGNIRKVGTKFYIVDTHRLVQTDANFDIEAWIGKVSNANGMTADTNSPCFNLASNANTPGWCQGGTSKNGMDESSFHQLSTIEVDGDGKLLTGQGNSYPAIKKWNDITGVYEGTLAFKSTSSRAWSKSSGFAGMHGFDDYSMNNPAGSWVDENSEFMYLIDRASARVKKIRIATGETMGWIGGITSTPTGGESGAACLSAAGMGPSPGWCLGSFSNPTYMWGGMIPSNTQGGIFNSPNSITGDANHLYITDAGLHRVFKFTRSTGALVGWIGRINASPTSGAAGCNGATGFTPGWCIGGTSQTGTGDGHLNQPLGILHHNGTLYVIDKMNGRVSSYNATTGAFNGWIGAINTNPSGGCTTANNGNGYLVSTNGWCTGGTGRSRGRLDDNTLTIDQGGGFSWENNYSNQSGLTTDGNYLIIANTSNFRIDRYTLAGVHSGSTSSNPFSYTQTWTTTPATIAAFAQQLRPSQIWTDGTHLFGTTDSYALGWNVIWKMNLSTGRILGWRGTIGSQPTGGDTGCDSTAVSNATPGWCQGGTGDAGYTLGKFVTPTGISGDANYIYVSDEGTHRLVRIPK